MSDTLGSGPALDNKFDLTIDRSGDLDNVSGIEELEKDLSMQVVSTLSEFIGAPPADSTRVKVKSRTKRVVLADDRVDRLIAQSLSVEWIGENREEIEVSMRIRANNQEQDLVFTV